MRRYLLLFISSFFFHAAYAKDRAPDTLESTGAVQAWAESTSFGGADVKEMIHKKKRLLVVIRQQASGVYSSEPIVFLRVKNKWVNVFQALPCPCAMKASVENSYLVFYGYENHPVEGKGGELGRLNLESLR